MHLSYVLGIRDAERGWPLHPPRFAPWKHHRAVLLLGAWPMAQEGSQFSPYRSHDGLRAVQLRSKQNALHLHDGVMS